MSPGNDERRPVGGGGSSNRLGGQVERTPAVGQSPTDDLAGRVRGAFVLVVEPTPGRYRRRTFLSLAAAERAAGKAEAAGYAAQVVLCRLEPVAGWQR